MLAYAPASHSNSVSSEWISFSVIWYIGSSLDIYLLIIFAIYSEILGVISEQNF